MAQNRQSSPSHTYLAELVMEGLRDVMHRKASTGQELMSVLPYTTPWLSLPVSRNEVNVS